MAAARAKGTVARGALGQRSSESDSESEAFTGRGPSADAACVPRTPSSSGPDPEVGPRPGGGPGFLRLGGRVGADQAGRFARASGTVSSTQAAASGKAAAPLAPQRTAAAGPARRRDATRGARDSEV